MKILIFSDIHIHDWPNFSSIGSNGMNTRLLDGLNVLKQIRQYCKDNQIKHAIFAGDFFHVRKISIEVYDLAYREIRKFKEDKINLIMIAGNHDAALRMHNSFSVNPFYELVCLLDGESVAQIGNTRIYGLPYQNKKQDFIKKASEQKADIIIGHIGVANMMASAFYLAPEYENLTHADMNKVFDKTGARLMVLGHFHNPQMSVGGTAYFADDEESKLIEDKKVIKGLNTDNIALLPGATMQHNWGDSGMPRGFWILDTNKWSIKFKEPDYPKFVTVKYSEMIETKESFLQNNFVKIEIDGKISKTQYNKLTSTMNEVNRNFQIINNNEFQDKTSRLNLGNNFTIEQAIDEYVNKFAENGYDKGLLKKKGLEILRNAEDE